MSSCNRVAPETSDLAATTMQLARYGVNCCVVLAVKLILIVLLTPWLVPAVAYLIVHIVTFFLSYAIHVRQTFRTRHSRSTLLGYLGAVSGFKVLDYLLFTLLVSWNLAAPLSVLVASSLEAVVKFFVVRRVLTLPRVVGRRKASPSC